MLEKERVVERYSKFKNTPTIPTNFGHTCERMEIMKTMKIFCKMIKYSFSYKCQTQLRRVMKKKTNKYRKEIKNNLRIGGVKGLSGGEQQLVYGRATIFRK